MEDPLPSLLAGVDGYSMERVAVRRPQPYFQLHLLTRGNSSSSPPRPGGYVNGDTHR